MGRNLILTDQGTVVLKEATANGTDSVTLQAPASLAAAYTLTLPTTDGGANEFLQTDGAGALTWATSTATLQSAYDNGGKITTAGTVPVEIEIGATSGNVGLLIDQDDDFDALTITKDGTGAGLGINLLNSGTGIGVFIDQDGDAIALSLDAAVASTSNVINLLNAGTGQGIFVNQDGNAEAIEIDHDGAGGNSLLINHLGPGTAVDITQQGAAAAINIVGGAAAAFTIGNANNNRCATFTKTGTGAGEALFIENDGTGAGLTVQQDGAGIGINLDQNADGVALNINVAGASTSHAIELINAGTGSAIDSLQTSATTTAHRFETTGDVRNGLFYKNDSGSELNFELQNEGTGNNLFLDQNGNGIAINIDSEATSAPLIQMVALASTNARGDIAFTARTAGASAPNEGDIWYDSTNHRFEMDVGSPATATGAVAIATRFGPSFGPAEDKTIATGAVSVTSGHLILTSETGTTDQLDTLTVTGAGPKEGDCVVLRAASTHTITVADSTDNIRLNGAASFALNSVNDTITLMYDSGTSQWIEISSSNNAA